MSNFIEVTELKRIGADERGWVIEPIAEAELINRSILNIHILCTEPGSVRGNHYHLDRQEHICVLAGTFLFVAVDNETGKRFELLTVADKSLCFTIPRNVSHAMKNLGQDRGYLLCYSDKAFNPDSPDTVKNIILV